jgi:signal transduction histidine kinase
VARRLAHEIKNPLTPIQLSAERLQHKLEAKLEGSDQTMLLRSVATIVSQVQAMKKLVNEFRDYARLPAAQLKPLDLNALVGEVLGCTAPRRSRGAVRAQLGQGLPMHHRRQHAAAAGHPQPGAERAGRHGRPRPTAACSCAPEGGSQRTRRAASRAADR